MTLRDRKNLVSLRYSKKYFSQNKKVWVLGFTTIQNLIVKMKTFFMLSNKDSLSKDMLTY